MSVFVCHLDARSCGRKSKQVKQKNYQVNGVSGFTLSLVDLAYGGGGTYQS